jgi:hypothetical protein
MIAGRPSPRRRQEAPQSGGVKPLRVAQPEGRGATRSRPLPASMASGVDLIAAPGGIQERCPPLQKQKARREADFLASIDDEGGLSPAFLKAADTVYRESR